MYQVGSGVRRAVVACALMAAAVAPGEAAAQGTRVGVCGPVSEYTPATSAYPGSLTIDGDVFALAPGVAVEGPMEAGSERCLTLTADSSGRIAAVDDTATRATPRAPRPAAAPRVEKADTAPSRPVQQLSAPGLPLGRGVHSLLYVAAAALATLGCAALRWSSPNGERNAARIADAGA